MQQFPQTAEQALRGPHSSLDALALQMHGPVKPLPWTLVPAVAVLATLWWVGWRSGRLGWDFALSKRKLVLVRIVLKLVEHPPQELVLPLN